MKLSTRGRYGIKAMVDLAVENGKKPVSVNTLASQQGISVAYLEQLVGALKKAKLVKSVRGVQGGYTLSRPPEDINVAEVLEALEGTTALVDCVGQAPSGCENACSCSARPLWLKLQNRINGVLQETTIKDMADDYIMQKRRLNDYASLS